MIPNSFAHLPLLPPNINTISFPPPILSHPLIKCITQVVIYSLPIHLVITPIPLITLSLAKHHDSLTFSLSHIPLPFIPIMGFLCDQIAIPMSLSFVPLSIVPPSILLEEVTIAILFPF